MIFCFSITVIPLHALEIAQCECDFTLGSEVGISNLYEAEQAGFIYSYTTSYGIVLSDIQYSTVCINGSFDLEYTNSAGSSANSFSFMNSTIIMDIGASMHVTSNFNFGIIESTVRGCDGLWDRIQVAPSANINVNQSTISDAYIGLYGQSESFVYVNYGIFRNNFIGIMTEEVGDNVDGNVTLALNGSTFESSGSIMSSSGVSYTMQPSGYALAGLWLNDHHGPIFTGAEFSDDCIYKNLSVGVVVHESNFDASRSVFINMQQVANNYGLTGRAGIEALDPGSSSYQFTVKCDADNKLVFSNCFYGIHSDKISVDVERTKFAQGSFGIKVGRIMGIPGYIKSLQNEFNDMYYGIFAQNNDGSVALEVEKNTINLVPGPSGPLAPPIVSSPPAGILSVNQSTGPLTSIIEENTINGADHSYGIGIANNLNHYDINGNKLNVDKMGIAAFNASSGNVIENVIVTSGTGTGLRYVNSSSLVTSCNEVYNSLKGTHTEGNCSSPDQFKENSFYDNIDALYQEAGSTLGNQNGTGNYFPNSGATYNGSVLNFFYVPSSPAPGNYGYPSPLNPSFGYFIHDPSLQHSIWRCGEIVVGDGFADTPSNEEEWSKGKQWISDYARISLAESANINIDKSQLDPSVVQFSEILKVSNIINTIHLQAFKELQAKKFAIAYNASAWSEEGLTPEAKDELSKWNTELDEIMVMIEKERSAQLQLLLAELSALAMEEPVSNALRDYIQHLILSQNMGADISEEVVSRYADLCVNEYGFPAAWSSVSSMLNNGENIFDFALNNCSSARSALSSNLDGKESYFITPSISMDGMFEINWSRDEAPNTSELKIYNKEGQMLSSRKLGSGQSIENLDLSHLPSGLYLAHFDESGARPFSQRIIIQH